MEILPPSPIRPSWSSISRHAGNGFDYIFPPFSNHPHYVTPPSFDWQAVAEMRSFILLSFVAFATTVVCQNHYKHGPTFGWRRGKAAYVVSAETTLRPGKPPNPQVPRLAVWPGMDTNGGLIQPIIVSTSQKEYPYVPRDLLCLSKNGYWVFSLAPV